jgi:SAM-dependent methyltransferase
MDWFHRLYEGRESFDEKEEEKAYREKQRALTQQEARDLRSLLRLAPGAKILDAYCGNGRHAIALAKSGFEVVGVDIALSRITFAKRWARDDGTNAAFVVADAKALCFRPAFDAVLVLGGSFTHFLKEEENIALLRVLRAALRPGGILLIDNPNPVRFWRIQHPHGPTSEQKALPYFDLPLGSGEFSGHVRYYSADEMKRLFQNADLLVQSILGNREGKPHSLDSPRTIIIGRAINTL